MPAMVEHEYDGAGGTSCTTPTAPARATTPSTSCRCPSAGTCASPTATAGRSPSTATPATPCGNATAAPSAPPPTPPAYDHPSPRSEPTGGHPPTAAGAATAARRGHQRASHRSGVDDAVEHSGTEPPVRRRRGARDRRRTHRAGCLALRAEAVRRRGAPCERRATNAPRFTAEDTGRKPFSTARTAARRQRRSKSCRTIMGALCRAWTSAWRRVPLWPGRSAAGARGGGVTPRCGAASGLGVPSWRTFPACHANSATPCGARSWQRARACRVVSSRTPSRS